MIQPGDGASARPEDGRPPSSAPASEPATTISGLPIQPIYAPADIAHIDGDQSIGGPGQYPYTRGIHATMYRGRPWTMRQFAGFGSARQTNERPHEQERTE